MVLMHPREQLCREAESELRLAIAAVTCKKGGVFSKLTLVEEMQVLNTVFSGEVGGILKYALRYERHGNTDTPAGFASEGKEDESDRSNRGD